MMRRVLILLTTAGVLLGLGWYAATRPVPADDAPPRLPNETAWIQRTFPYFQADPGAYRAAFVQAHALRAAAKTDVFGAWELVGPTNVGGRMVDVAFDPATPSTVYAAAATGGVFKSTDTGQTWQPIFDDQPVMTIGDLALAPSDPQVIYVGTGEANGGHNNFAGSGVYASDDGGASWRFAGLAETVSIGRIRVHPTDPQRVFVAAVGSYFGTNSDRGLYRSDDGGASWDRIFFANDSTGVIDFVFQPDDPDDLLVATWERVRRPGGAQLGGAGSGLWRSTNGGTTWTRLGPAEGLPGGPAGRIGLTLCEGQPNVVYALYTTGTNYLGFFRSDDGGQTWTDADPDGELRIGFGGFSWYFGQVRVHPRNPNLVFVLDVWLMRSTDGGANWQRITASQEDLHVDHHALAFHPDDPSLLIDGNDGGLSRSIDAGLTWESAGDLPVTQFYEITVDPTNPQRFFGGTQDNGTLRSDTNAPCQLYGRDREPGDWCQFYGGDGFYVLVDPSNPDVVYAESQNGALVKFEGTRVSSALNGTNPSEPRNWSTPVVMDPQNPQVLYYGTNRVYRTRDGAANWTAISGDLTRNLGQSLLGTVSTLAVAPSNTSVLWAGTDDGNVWVSADGGTEWTDVTAPNLPLRWITRVVPDPTDDRIAYLTFSGLKWQDATPHVFRTTDQGQTWTDIATGTGLPDAPVNAFAVDPRNPDFLYLGSDVGAFFSPDAGGSWEALGEGLPAVVVNDLTIFDDGTQRFLVAGTHGRSMHTLDLSAVPFPTPTAVEDARPAPDAFVLEPTYPNPFTARTTLTYRLADAARVRLDVFDLLGRSVATLADGTAAPGTHTAVWEAGGAAPGAYFARLRAETPAGALLRTVTLTRVR